MSDALPLHGCVDTRLSTPVPRDGGTTGRGVPRGGSRLQTFRVGVVFDSLSFLGLVWWPWGFSSSEVVKGTEGQHLLSRGRVVGDPEVRRGEGRVHSSLFSCPGRCSLTRGRGSGVEIDRVRFRNTGGTLSPWYPRPCPDLSPRRPSPHLPGVRLLCPQSALPTSFSVSSLPRLSLSPLGLCSL